MKDFKVRCIYSGPCHEKGKIYDVVNGRIMKNDGKFSTCVSFHSVDKLNELWISKFELVEEEKMFTKDDLKSGYIVDTRNRGLFMVLETANGLKSFFRDFCEFGHHETDQYNDDLTAIGNDAWDITRIYGFNRYGHMVREISTKGRELLWQRDETLELTIEEIAKKFGVDAGRVRIKE